MAVEVHVKPSALSRTVTGAYASPAEAKRNRLLRKYRGMTDDQRSAVDVKTLTDEEREAFQVVVNERLAEAFKDKEKAAKLVTAAKEYLNKQPLSTYLKPSMISMDLGTVDPAVYKLIVGESMTYNDNPPYLHSHYSTKWGPQSSHPKKAEGEGKKVAEVVLKVGTHTVELGAAVAVTQETVAEPEIVDFSMGVPPETQIPQPKYHTRLTFEMRDWCEVLKALGWYPTCGHHAGYCQDWSHYSPPLK